MLKEGTRSYSSIEIAHRIENVGASVAFPFSFDAVNAATIGLTRFFDELLPVHSELVLCPSFLDEEFDLLRRRILQKLHVDLAQNDVLAYRLLTEKIFGTDHPYGYNSTEELYSQLETKDLRAYHERSFGGQNAALFISGKMPLDWQQKLNDAFGHWQSTTILPQAVKVTGGQLGGHIEQEWSGLQTAIRIGRRLFRTSHPDFATMVLLNAVLGGYYGSRLMHNLREKKGLTYGVHSSIDTHSFDSFLNISVETDRLNSHEVMLSIRHEIDQLQQHVIDEGELNMVKNYLGGHFLSLIDGPFATAEVMRISWLESTSITALQDLFSRFAEITPSDLLLAAQRHLAWDQLTKVIIH